MGFYCVTIYFVVLFIKFIKSIVVHTYPCYYLHFQNLIIWNVPYRLYSLLKNTWKGSSDKNENEEKGNLDFT